MIIWLEEAYGIDESYEAMCQILATDGEGIVFLEIDLTCLKEMAGIVSFQPDADLITPLWREIEAILDGGGRGGRFSASMIIAAKKEMNWLLCPPCFQMLDYVMSLSGVARKSRHTGREFCTQMAVVVDMAGPVCLLLSLCLDKGLTPAI